MGLIFGGAHQLSMVRELVFHESSTNLPQMLSFAVYYLCKHPEYLEPLKEEAAMTATKAHEETDYDQMQLMDSFLRETARLNPTMIRELSGWRS